MHRPLSSVRPGALACLAALAAFAPARAADAPPNVVFILVDDLRHDALGCAGHPFVKTPHIDRLAKEGARLTNAFVTTPLCSPSRASFLTGQYAGTHGVKRNGDNAALSHKLVTWPRLLHDAGYETAYVGKWHMGNDDSPRPGFDRWVSFKGQGRFDDPPLNVDGKAVQAKGYMTDLLSGHAVDFVKKGRAKPFALCLAHKAVHGPFTPAERHKDLYKDDKYTPPPNVEDTLEGKPALKPKDGQPAPAGGNHDRIMREQLRCVASIDEGVDKLLAALEEAKQLDNTLIVFTSDNGYFWGEHKLGDKRAAYEESVRIPLIVRHPKLAKAGSTVDGLALNIDLAPTFLEAAGLKAPAGFEGRSLLPLLRGETKGWRTSVTLEYFQEERYPRVPTWRAVRSERWKYIHYPEVEGADELYDLKADAHELKNRVKDADAAAALKELKAALPPAK